MKSSTRFHLAEIHWPLLLVVACIAALGCYNLHSAAAHHDARLYLTQMGWFALGLGLVMVVLTVDYRVTESFAYVTYGIVVLLLLAVLLTGKSAMGARRWLILGPLTFQPSEIAKIPVIFCMARYFSHRIAPGGYSIGGLVRPLNPTRPLACIGALVLSWNKPYLADPVGELARGIHHQLGNQPPELENLLWFRFFLGGLLVVGCVLSLFMIVRAEREGALLNPWPQGRKRRLLTLTVLFFLALGAGLATAWDAPVLADPFGVAIGALNNAARRGGRYHSLRPGLALRLFFASLAFAYLAASILSLRRGVNSFIDVLIAPLDLLVVPALMVLVQPDLGSSGIILLIGMTMILIVGVRLRSLIIMGILGALISGVSWFGVLKDYQKRRILTFIDPEQDIKGAGWNAVQSLIAVGSGRWFGKGHMGGTQTQLSFLPEQHTDFAFSVWAEEQGFVGCLVVLVLYLVLLSLAFAIAADARDTYGVLLATGLAALILWQAVINVGMVIGVLPVVGLTLPLFSYGGSSVLTVMLGVGLLLNIHLRRRAH
jgi:cell division protein FtsW (lipid II flippase)